MSRLNLLEETRYEKLPVTVYPDQQTAATSCIADSECYKKKITKQ
jgi:glucosamine-6-phosphate deaminase